MRFRVLFYCTLTGLWACAAWGGTQVLLDERWDIELKQQDTEVQTVLATQAADPRVTSGTVALEVRNTDGKPAFRLRGVGPVRAGDLASSKTQLRLRYRTDAYGGQIAAQLSAYYRPAAEQTFVLYSVSLDGGGKDGALVADNQWHTATGVLTPTEFTPKVPANEVLPLYLMIRAGQGPAATHTTYFDLVELIDTVEPGKAPAAAVAVDPREGVTLLPPAGVVAWTDGSPRPMPKYSGRVVPLTPQSDLQKALDAAQPGDVLTLAPGRYPGGLRATVAGDPDAPIALVAEEPGTVVLSNAGDPPNFRLVSGDLYEADVPYRVRALRADGRMIQVYPTRANLEQWSMPVGGGRIKDKKFPEGFAWEDGKVYIRLYAGQDPRKCETTIHRAYDPQDDKDGTGEYWQKLDAVWAGEAARIREKRIGGTLLAVSAPHWRIGGVRFDMAPELGVNVSADDVRIHDCHFSGVLYGIMAFDVADFVLEHCEYTYYPRFEWMRWAETTQGNWDSAWGDELAIPCFLHHSGPRHRVLNNHVYDALDAFRPRWAASRDPKDMSEYAWNFVHSCSDECIEFDSKPTLNLRVHHNVLMDAVMPLAFSPVLDGKLIVDHNLVYQSSRGLLNCGLVKFYMIPSWKSLNIPTAGITIVHNTMVNPQKAFYWTGEDHHFARNLVENNIFWVWRADKWALPGFEVSRFNLYRGSRINGLDHLADLMRDRDPGFVSSPAMPRDPAVAPFTGFVDTDIVWTAPHVDLRLAEGSPCIDAGAAGFDAAYGHASRGSAPDLGAIEFGDAWQFPRPGPRWAVGNQAIRRPALPPEIAPEMVGLAP